MCESSTDLDIFSIGRAASSEQVIHSSNYITFILPQFVCDLNEFDTHSRGQYTCTTRNLTGDRDETKRSARLLIFGAQIACCLTPVFIYQPIDSSECILLKWLNDKSEFDKGDTMRAMCE